MKFHINSNWYSGLRGVLPAAPSTVLAVLGALVSSGCALFLNDTDRPFMPGGIEKPARAQSAMADGAKPPGEVERKTGFYQTPKPPAAVRDSVGKPPPPTAVGPADDAIAAVNLENMPLAQFANAVYAGILKRNISIDPAVQQRPDLVSLRTGKPQSADKLFSAAQAVLRSYGVAVNEFQGLVRIVPDKSEVGYLPEIRRGRAQPEIPTSLRPIFYLAELEHTTVQQAVTWLRSLYGARLTAQEDASRNSIMLSGQSDTVNAAMEALQMLDQPLMRGRSSLRITPVFWSAEELAKRLVELLQAEGYAVSQSAGANVPVLILPIGAVNSVIIFASNKQALEHAARWARELDQTPPTRSTGFINYPVRNTSAADLAKTLQEIVGGAPVSAQPSTTGVATASPAAVSGGGKKVVVNPSTNSLIIQTNPTEFQQWYGLLQELDRPAKAALIMATVAEINLTDTENYGFQWLLDQFRLNGNIVKFGTTSSISVPSSGPRLSVANLAGDPRALLTFLASHNKVRILSNPSVIARNGEGATIQVGREVPILTSQISNANTGGTTGTGILQTIQYRNTGVILRVKPIIHSGGRLDLDVAQEVSDAAENTTGVNTTPVISSRKIETKLTISDGNTMVLGGLISENRSLGNSGIPYLKDIPVIGSAFRTAANQNVTRTELVVMLTPYVIEDDFDANAMTQAFRAQFGWADSPSPAIKSGTKGAGGDEQAPVDAPEPGGTANLGTGIRPASPPAAVKTPTPQSSARYRSAPYELPEGDGPPLRMSTGVVSSPQAAQGGALPDAGSAVSSPTVANLPQAPVSESVNASGNGAKETGSGSQGAEMRPVTDEKLKQELLQAVKGGSK